MIVCVKYVLDTAEVELKIDSSGKAIESRGLILDINECDRYALEEAVRLKENIGGTVTIVTASPEGVERALRKCLAMGADKAISVIDKSLAGSDWYVTAKILYKVVQDLHFDVIFAGAQARDDGYATVGPALARLLGIPHVTMVKKIELKDGFALVNRELEGGLEEIVEVKLPAVLTIQTGINEPRYVSLLSVKKAAQKEIKALGLADIGLSENEVGETNSWIKIEKFFVPPAEKEVKIIKGSPEEIVTKIIEILKTERMI